MKQERLSNQSERIYRVDKFIVPDHAREEFLEKVQATHQLLKKQSGFLQDFVLEQASGPGEFNIVTMVEWNSIESIEPARAAVMALHQEMKFNPQELFTRLGIKADLGNYKRVGI
ncbi:MAG: antibiotic biosynthesis monooxygenase [Anaerolineaceae bacterium]|nr:antibiotic biosynthesis monooxygenase [Anaerolineaceae bacterium]MCB9099100.1 antibiotic biosynthesis monooxygenase [Anaerolineales bacterium]